MGKHHRTLKQFNRESERSAKAVTVLVCSQCGVRIITEDRNRKTCVSCETRPNKLLATVRSMTEFAEEVQACGWKFATSKTGNWLVYDEDGNNLLWWNPTTKLAFIKGKPAGKRQDPLDLIESCM